MSSAYTNWDSDDGVVSPRDSTNPISKKRSDSNKKSPINYGTPEAQLSPEIIKSTNDVFSSNGLTPSSVTSDTLNEYDEFISKLTSVVKNSIDKSFYQMVNGEFSLFSARVSIVENEIVTSNQTIISNNDALLTRIASNEGMISNIYGELTIFDNRVDLLSNDMVDINSTLSSLTSLGDVSSILSQITSINSSLVTVQSSIQSISSINDSQSTSISNILAILDQNTISHGVVNNQISQLIFDVDRLDSDVGNISNSLVNISNSISEILEHEEEEELIFNNNIIILNYKYYSDFEDDGALYVIKKSSISNKMVIKRVEEVGSTFDIRYSNSFDAGELPTKMSNIHAVGFIDLLSINI